MSPIREKQKSSHRKTFKQTSKVQQGGPKKKKRPAPYMMHDTYFHKAKAE